MEYNPFSEKCNQLRDLIDQKNNYKGVLIDDLRWFDSNDISDLFYSLEEKQKLSDNYKALIEGIGKEIKILNADIKESEKPIKNIFNPFNWFDGGQRLYRKKLGGLRIELEMKKVHKEKVVDSLSGACKSINKIRYSIERYKGFDRGVVSNNIDGLDRDVGFLEKKVVKIYELKNNVDVALKPVVQQISGYESSLSLAKEKLSKAQSFERKLDSADNSYERAMIHEECEKTFGDGSPKKIIRQQESAIRKFERDLEKAKKRAVLVARKASRDIKKLVIDGNNMCYEGGSFVGLSPLVASTIELQKNYEVIIVFDSAIRSQVKANDQAIRERFSNNIKVHVVATKQLADETILDIASGDAACYILSNDRFGEYMEKEVVTNNRLLNHEIVDRKVIIHDLSVNVRYA